MSKSEQIEIEEYDEAGNVVTTYIASGESRVDVVLPRETKSYAQQLLDVFLPAGYPHSVTEDYIQYQIYDSLQAFSSSIAGLLASRAVLEGVGVGDSTASPTSALLLSILQESMGRLATIMFAHRLGTSLEPECKMYRLAADIFNDTAMILDCLSPAFPKPARVVVLSFSSCLRALCGVCAGSAKASLSAHFAKRGNLGELNAKDSSQETVISLLGMLAGSLVVSWVTTPMATWATLIALLSVHLAMNYAAVKAVSMTNLNRQRANIVFSHLLDAKEPRVLSPKEVSEQERVFERDGVLRYGNEIIGHCRIGISLQSLFGGMSLAGSTKAGAFKDLPIKLPDFLEIFEREGYILWHNNIQTREVLIVLKKGCTAIDHLKAWVHALMLVRMRSQAPSSFRGPEDEALNAQRLVELLHTLRQSKELFNKYTPALRSAGWDLDTAALETQAGVRALIDRSQDSSGT
ncbi:DUF647-domain-containing protein [Didymella exigua CBS 183.55]|uniref:DUF647-domain-containing protein n=1 Tax=Didymella exigua CBS 183.55 TaxID=1150837 RepID=A0A6A5RJW3_9PLEO|nr:DUF647-domain-containing protein [Didymella exigua CBS 183.55]KAF1928655.1 DUF647-domain-containing protein [Didymella exigua CBS 183.55]